jgi:hypothetical protein
MEETKGINLMVEKMISSSTDDFSKKQRLPSTPKENISYYEDTSPSTGVSLEAERMAFKNDVKYWTRYHKYSNERVALIIDILDAPEDTIGTCQNELQEILRAAQSAFEVIVEFKGRVVVIDEEVAEITIYEEGRNETYTNLDSTYLTDIGLSQGDSFVLTIVNDNGIEVPVFKPDKEAMEGRERAIGLKSEESRRQALDSQKDLDELYKFIKQNESKQ